MDKHVTQTVKIKQTPAERIEELKRDGEFFRAGVAHSKAQIRHGARPEVLFHSAVDHAPYALTAIKFIRHRKLGKPALAISVLLGVAGWYFQRRRAQQVVETPTY
jgi:hypothetical protein